MEFLKKHNILRTVLPAMCMALVLPACREESEVLPPEKEQPGESQQTELTGFYLLNEGNMGSNKASLDLYTFADGIYSRNIYAQANPDIPKELGDVGNDMQPYGSRLWITVNCSNKVEVLDLHTARRFGQIDIPNCRYMAFYGGSAYVTSYAGPVEINPEYTQRGFVARVDTLTLEVTGRVNVGFQPDGIAMAGNRLYVANSGGYMVPNYENTVSVIDPATMKVTETIEIAINLDRIIADRRGRLWISSRGDYFDTPSRLYVYDPAQRKIIREFDTPVGAMWLDGDSLYVISRSFNYLTESAAGNFIVFDTENIEQLTGSFITDGTGSDIRTPYGVAVNPATKEIYVTDAGNYVNPGRIHCYSPSGIRKWSQRTGDIPSRFVFF